MIGFKRFYIFIVLVFASLSSLAASDIKELPKRQIKIKDTVFSVEVARTNEEQKLGLMHRPHLPEKTGMLFIFDTMKNQKFWMKNTLIPLDIIFLDKDYKVVGVVPNAKPLSLKTLEVGKPSQIVLELNANEAKKYGIEVGSKLEILSPSRM